MSSLEPVGADRGAHRFVVENARSGRIAAGAGSHEQRNQVFLARMAEPSMGSALPFREQGIALRSGRLYRGRQPGIELPRRLQSLWAEVGTQIMEAHSAADDRHAFLAQRGKRPPGRDVHRRIKRSIGVGRQRQRDHGNVGQRKRHLERNEDTVVVAPRAAQRRSQAGFFQQDRDALRQRRIARRGPGELIGMNREIPNSRKSAAEMAPHWL